MLFKKHPKTLKFINLIQGVAETYPVLEAKNIERKWVITNGKKLHEFNEYIKSKCPMSALKGFITNNKFFPVKCPGLRTFMSTGYIITLPFDVIVETNGDGKTIKTENFQPELSFKRMKVEEFNSGDVPMPQNMLKNFLKIETGWNVIPVKGLKFLVCPVSYTDETRFSCVNGILDPFLSPEMNIILYWHVLNGREFIKAGTPLCQLIPIFDNLSQPKIEIKTAVSGPDFFRYVNSLTNIKQNSAVRDYKKIKDVSVKLFDKIFN